MYKVTSVSILIRLTMFALACDVTVICAKSVTPACSGVCTWIVMIVLSPGSSETVLVDTVVGHELPSSSIVYVSLMVPIFCNSILCANVAVGSEVR